MASFAGRRVGPPLGSRRLQCLSRPSRGNGRTAGHGPSTRVVFGINELTQNRPRLFSRRRDRCGYRPPGVRHRTAWSRWRGFRSAARLRVATLTLVNIHTIENAGSGDDTGDLSDTAFCTLGFTLSDIRQLLDVRQGVKSANPVLQSNLPLWHALCSVACERIS